MSAETSSPIRARRQPYLPVVIGIFVIAGCALLPYYRYELGPDGISYVSIASQYAAGYWREAINAYWGPLYSWCIAILLLLRIPALISVKVLGIVFGVAALFGLHRLAAVFAMENRFRRVFLWVGGAMLLGFAMDSTTPDLLFTAILFFYFSLIFDPAFPRSSSAGLVCGILGGLGYLAKSYGLFFFAAHFILLSALHFLVARDPAKRSKIMRQFAAGFVVFCAISFAWVAVLHSKYGRWTTGTSGDFNLRLVGPQSKGYPQFRQLIPPTSPHALTAWQEPSPSWLPHWSVLESRSNSIHEGKVVYGNAKLALRMWAFAAPFFVVIIPLYVLVCVRLASAEWIYPLFTIALFCGGYVLVSVENRYLWPAELLLLWMGFRSLELLSKSFRMSRALGTAATCLLGLSFLMEPVLTLRAHFLVDRRLYSQSEVIKRSKEIKGRLASCANWQDSAYLAFLLGDPYYGVPAPVPEADEVARELNPDYRPGPPEISEPNEIVRRLSEERIDYFILWPDCHPLPAGAGTAEIQAGDLQLVKLSPNSGH